MTIGSTTVSKVTSPGEGTFTYDTNRVVNLIATLNQMPDSALSNGLEIEDGGQLYFLQPMAARLGKST